MPTNIEDALKVAEIVDRAGFAVCFSELHNRIVVYHKDGIDLSAIVLIYKLPPRFLAWSISEATAIIRHYGSRPIPWRMLAEVKLETGGIELVDQPYAHPEAPNTYRPDPPPILPTGPVSERPNNGVDYRMRKAR